MKNPVTEYINSFPEEVQDKLLTTRKLILELVPEAEEKISYGIPTYKLGKNLVHFAATKNHIGFYPTPSAIDRFANELSGYKTSKGAIQFPLDESLPVNLIKNIVIFRVKEIKDKPVK